MSRRLAELRLPEIGRISETSILIQPVGSIEQHGPHLPYNTDLVIPERTAEELVDRLGDELDLWLLPSLVYTRSGEHSWAAGTVWLSSQTLLSVLSEVACSLSGLPARKLVFLNGHGGNSSLLNVACRDIRRHHGFQTFLMHPMVPPDQGGQSSDSEAGSGIHAGYLETSLMMHLAPDLVASELPRPVLPESVAGNVHVRFGGSVTFGWTSDDFSKEGHIGDPTGASAAIGRDVFESIVTHLGRALQEIRDFAI
jgi:creatinine amidohydrolase